MLLFVLCQWRCICMVAAPALRCRHAHHDEFKLTPAPNGMQKCGCGKDCTCTVCSGQQSRIAEDKGSTANPPGAGETRQGQVSTT